MTTRAMTARRLRIALGIGCALFLGSCAWIPEGDPPAEYLEPPEMKETLAEVTSRLQQWPEDRWWEQFGNPELNELIETAIKDNPGLKLASARLRQAEALVKVEGARLLPFLEADASLTYERLSQHGVFAALNPEVAGARFMLGIINPLSFRYEFDFWGKNRAMLEAALGHAAAEEAEKAEVRLRLTTGIARAYFRGQALQQQLNVVRALVGIRRDLRKLAETRYRLGLDNDQPVKIAVADYETAFKRQAGVRDQLDVQRHLLARLAGKGPDEAAHLFTKPMVAIPGQIPAPDHLSIGSAGPSARPRLSPLSGPRRFAVGQGRQDTILSHDRSHRVRGLQCVDADERGRQTGQFSLQRTELLVWPGSGSPYPLVRRRPTARRIKRSTRGIRSGRGAL